MYCSFFKDKKLHDPYERHETHNTLSSFITSYKKNPFPIKNQSRDSTKWKLAYIYCSVKWRNKKATKTTNFNFTL